MREVYTLLERKYPGASKSKFWRDNVGRVTRQYAEILRLEKRRPDVFEMALIALIDWYGSRAHAEVVETRKAAKEALEGLSDV